MTYAVTAWEFRDVFDNEREAVAALQEAERQLSPHGELTFATVLEGKLGRWVHVVIRKRFTRERIGYLGRA